jgi:hypothetical protein
MEGKEESPSDNRGIPQAWKTKWNSEWGTIDEKNEAWGTGDRSSELSVILTNSLIKSTKDYFLCLKFYTPSLSCNIQLKKKKNTTLFLWPCLFAHITTILWELSKNIIKKTTYPGKNTWQNDSFDHRSVCKKGKIILRKDAWLKKNIGETDLKGILKKKTSVSHWPKYSTLTKFDIFGSNW